MTQKQLEVQIMGQSYLLGCPEGGEGRLLEAVERVDTAMCKIRDAGKVRARDRIAVLASLNLAFDLSDRAQASGPTAVVAVASAAAPVPSAPASAPAPTAPSAASTAALQPRELQTLQQLIHRLDDVLSQDGQLL